MTISMYDLSIPVFVKKLKNVSAILDKANHYAETKKFDSVNLVTARLAPDMLPLARQVQIATDVVKGCAARLAGIDVPSYPDTESTISELQARIQKTIDFLEGITVSQVQGSETRAIDLKVGGQDKHFTGQEYLSYFVIPNFYFHITTTYAILRHNGLDIGKKDYLG